MKNIKKILKLTTEVFSEWYFTAKPLNGFTVTVTSTEWFWAHVWVKTEMNAWIHDCICPVSLVLFSKRKWGNNWAVLKNLLNLRACSQLELSLCRYLQICLGIKANPGKPGTFRVKWGRDKRMLPKEKIWILAILSLKCRWKMVDKKQVW